MSATPFDISGRTALVTGSSRGIGRHLAEVLLAAGAHVILHGASAQHLQITAAELMDSAGYDRVATVDFDVTDRAAVRRSLDELQDDIGGIDILVNNAGIQHRQPLLEFDLDAWDRLQAVNLSGPMLVARQLVPRMLARGSGKIVNIASVQADLARPGIAGYTVTKGGLRNLTRAMAAEWAGGGVQINAVAPGYIRTEMTRALVDDPEFSEWVVGRTPARRWGEPSDVAGAVLWLVSPASDFVNGQTIFVDGGMSVVV